ncbi:helix-turn-helix transcriptional regulator [Methanosarcina mazei]|nr:Lrp/AsnC family transcriptional regulator [Methanosarcina mazei]KKG02854.1 AsnC family transcriptional regulator [Methanosarcina mazei]KKG05058.1 AsnC family transcriptional regulator [Methanosarcina mazei]KKG07293.1 AsnC family transcriptional regulator [Methanosarcina mazei]KKG08276.1 AsnC family transcriptional regulator [Methanosarcina mazei]KKG31773.1 AsnC family transcriptional regulator [Methanosarcina mazei]
MDLEEEAYNIIRRHKDGVFQNVIWKELDIDSRKCSRIIKKLLDKDLIIREVGVSNGARTYLLKAKEEVKEKYDLLLSGDMFSACTGCTGDCEPEYCGRLSEWIGNLMVEEAEEAGEVEEAEDMDVEAEDEDKFKEEI